MRLIKRLSADRKGATAIEYGLIASLIAVAAIVAITQVGTQAGANLNNVTNCIKGGATC
ncbi:MAG TPA: Flp family type IVb pilin [Allosphingosinicella sp.]|jgi:pilus assembly protein Flp/PilA